MLEDLPAAIRFHRRRAGLSQAALARLAGVGKTVVFDIERGKATVRQATLLRVLDTLNIKLSWSSPLATEFARAQPEAAADAPTR